MLQELQTQQGATSALGSESTVTQWAQDQASDRCDGPANVSAR